jgi:hypothetical protein
MTTKYLKNVSGAITEVATVSTSAGAGDVDKIPSLNASGVLPISITNGVTSSAGAGDSGKVAALDGSGRLDTTMMPVGMGADSAIVTTSEAVASGDLVNIWDSTGAKCRKADATVAGKEAHGFVLVGVGSAAAATVYFEGSNTGVTGLTPGVQYLTTTAGISSHTPPAGAGNVIQRVGFATAAAVLNFQSQPPITLI